MIESPPTAEEITEALNNILVEHEWSHDILERALRAAPVSARVPLSEAEPDGRVSVPKYPSGVVTYTKDSRGWTIRTEDVIR